MRTGGIRGPPVSRAHTKGQNALNLLLEMPRNDLNKYLQVGGLMVFEVTDELSLGTAANFLQPAATSGNEMGDW